MFLAFITLKNLIIDLNELIMLIVRYFIVFWTLAMILVAIVRLYYDLRLGEEYEQKMEEQRKQKQYEQKIRKQKKQQLELKQIINQAKRKHKKQDKNKYRVEEIILQQEQIQLLEFIQKKNWTKLQKEKYYYQKYAQKPMAWLQKHDKEQYSIRLNEIREKLKIKKNQKFKRQYDQSDLKSLEIFKKQCREELKEKQEQKSKKKYLKQEHKNYKQKNISQINQKDKTQRENFKPMRSQRQK